MKTHRFFALVVFSIVFIVLAGTAGLTPALAYTIAITEFAVPTSNSEPAEIAAGPDGNLWFTELNANKIGRITPSGTITEFLLPTANSEPLGITTGPDDNLWFTEFLGNKIGRRTLMGIVTEFSLPTAGSGPWEITVGPDGNLWFTEWNGSKIGRITPSGIITEFTIPTANSSPDHIKTGPDGNLWFTERNGNKIGRITPTGTITEFTIPTINSQPEGITVGLDGNLWFAEHGGNKIGRMTPTGSITEFAIPTFKSGPGGITVGPDGNLWFCEHNAHKIGRITLSGTITEFAVPTGNSLPDHITTGPDGKLWFTEEVGNQIGRVSFSPAFTDVPTTYWAWSEIERLYAAHFTGGCIENPLAYCPERPVTRAEMAVFIERGIHGSDYTPPAATGTVFVDVPLSYWDTDWIEQLYADHITGGCLASPLTYCPDSPTTRAEMAVFLLKAEHGADYNPPAAVGIFTDVPTNYWDASWIEQLYAEKITGGCSSSPLSYCPENQVTRAEMAVFLVRTFPTTMQPYLNPMVEQARAFADPILTVIADSSFAPNFEDDFSTNKGWGPFGEPCPFGIEDGVLRVHLGVGSCAFTLEALTRKDFVLQFDSRLVVGDMMSGIRVNYHHTVNGILQLAINSKAQTWFITVLKPEGNSQIAYGTGLVSSIGKFTQVTIITRGPKSAIYINGTPVGYIEDVDFDTSGATWFSCESFSETTCEFDNVKLWELAYIPGLP